MTLSLSARDGNLLRKSTLGFSGGAIMPGPLSHSEVPVRAWQTGFTFNTSWPSYGKKFGMETGFGLVQQNYTFRIEQDRRLRWRVRSATLTATAFYRVSEKVKVHIGLMAVVPFSEDLREELIAYPGRKFLFGLSNGIGNNNHPLPQVGATAGVEYLAGKKEQAGFGLFVTQTANEMLAARQWLWLPNENPNNRTRTSAGKNVMPFYVTLRMAFRLKT